MEIKNVVLAKYEEDEEINGNKRISRWDPTKTRLCLVESDRAIDCETKEEYELIKRNSRGQIINDIENDKEYGFDVQDVSFMDKVSGYVKLKKKNKMKKKK